MKTFCHGGPLDGQVVEHAGPKLRAPVEGTDFSVVYRLETMAIKGEVNQALDFYVAGRCPTGEELLERVFELDLDWREVVL